MQALAGEFLANPAYGLIAAIVVVGALTCWVLYSAGVRRDAGDPLDGLFNPATFDSQFETISERAARAPRRPVTPLRGQRAQFARLREVWQHDTREEVIEEIARVMRASKDASPEPTWVVNADPVSDVIDWEEIKLLPPPASQAA